MKRGIQAEEKERNCFSIEVSSIESEKQLIGKWVFSEAWSMHMGLALEINADHTFRYWFKSDVIDDTKYPFTGSWEIMKGTLRLSTEQGHLYASELVLANYKGIQGLFSPDDIKVLIWQSATPDTRFIIKLGQEPLKWPVYNLEF